MTSPTEILNLFDEWLRYASEAQIAENCRTEGAAFFHFMAERGVHPGFCANLIKDATGYSARWLWRNAPQAQIRASLINYVYTQQDIRIDESELGHNVSPDQAMNTARKYWSK